MNSAHRAASWALTIGLAIASALVIDLASRAMFVTGGSDAAAVVWGPRVAPWLVVLVGVVSIVAVAASRGVWRAGLLVLWLAGLAVATHRVVYDVPTGEVRDRWLGMTVRSTIFAEETTAGLTRCTVTWVPGICVTGGGAVFRTIAVLPVAQLVADADGRLVAATGTAASR